MSCVKLYEFNKLNEKATNPKGKYAWIIYLFVFYMHSAHQFFHFYAGLFLIIHTSYEGLARNTF